MLDFFDVRADAKPGGPSMAPRRWGRGRTRIVPSRRRCRSCRRGGGAAAVGRGGIEPGSVEDEAEPFLTGYARCATDDHVLVEQVEQHGCALAVCVPRVGRELVLDAREAGEAKSDEA